MKHLTLAVALTALTASTMSAVTPRGVDRANLNPAVAPGQDFYEYACGGWMKANPLKPEYSRFGTFDQLAELNRTQVRELIEGLNPATAAKGSNEQKIGDLFALGMDSTRLNYEGNKPVLKDLAAINAVTRDGVVDLLATLPGVSGFFGSGVEADMMNADRNAMYWNSSLGLGDRDYYLVNEGHEKDVRDAYAQYLITIARLAGYDKETAERLAENTLAVETAIAKQTLSREEQRNPMAMYNPRKISELAKEYKAIDLHRYFAKQGINDIEEIIIAQPKTYAVIDSLLSTLDETAIRDYLSAGYLASAAPYLSDDFIAANFELAKVKSGVQQMQPRWKRALNVPNGMLGEAVGELYVAKYFPPVAKEKMLKLVDNLKTALGQHISNLTWMSDETKAKGLEKLNAFTVKIGYPDKLKDYSALTVDPSKSYWENIQEAIMFNTKDNLDDWGKPVDRDRWYMSPQTVNAYYNPTTNEICFPAGILQAPYFNPDADDAENYGAIGVVIGHEMTHGFDDQGRQFDKDGNYANWWTEADAEAFNKLADGLANQFDQIVVLGDTHANGRFTLGENIADQGGLRVAYTAYHNALNGEGEVKDGFTPDQRFYLSYANVWAGNIRDAEILSRTKTDPHSLGRWRVNASLRNLQPFFDAFGIKEGDAMWRPVEERVIIW